MPRPFSACAGAMRCADRAGSQPPTSAAAMPSSAVAGRGAGIEAKRRRDAGKVAAAEVAAEEAQRDRGERAAEGEAEDAAGRAEQRRLGEDEAEPLRARSGRARASSASCCTRCATERARIEKTRNAPVNIATSASTVRLTR